MGYSIVQYVFIDITKVSNKVKLINLSGQQRPLSLPCGHVYCQTCLNKIAKTNTARIGGE